MESQEKIWYCPKCTANGLKNQVQLKQINQNEALYICEEKSCLYPLEALKKFPLKLRHVGDIPVSKQHLEALSLPLSLSNEFQLVESNLENLIELSCIQTQASKMYEAKEAWESFATRMLSEGEDLPQKFRYYRDADLDKLHSSLTLSLPYIHHVLGPIPSPEL